MHRPVVTCLKQAVSKRSITTLCQPTEASMPEFRSRDNETHCNACIHCVLSFALANCLWFSSYLPLPGAICSFSFDRSFRQRKPNQNTHTKRHDKITQFFTGHWQTELDVVLNNRSHFEYCCQMLMRR